ncbi:MAG TPA: TPM domain-containing protein [Povalibacter sp.]
MFRTALLLVLLFSPVASGFEVPPFAPNVVDLSGVLTVEEIGQLNATIAKIRQENHVLAAVLIVPTTQPGSIEQAAEEVFRTWQLGSQGTDNGLLILAATGDRRVRIEVGYGLEGAIPDVMANRIIQSTLVPNFKEQRYAAGLVAALERCGALAAQRETFDVEAATTPAAAPPVRPWLRTMVWPALIWIGLIVVVPVALRFAAVQRAVREHHAHPGIWHIINPSGASLFVTLFLLVNPGMFFLIFVHKGWAIFSPLFICFAYVFLCAVNWPYISMLRGRSGSSGFRRQGRRWFAADAFGSGSTGSSHSSSSASSSRSSSSSSGSSSSSRGGSSGGGGASGSW